MFKIRAHIREADTHKSQTVHVQYTHTLSFDRNVLSQNDEYKAKR